MEQTATVMLRMKYQSGEAEYEHEVSVEAPRLLALSAGIALRLLAQMAAEARDEGDEDARKT